MPTLRVLIVLLCAAASAARAESTRVVDLPSRPGVTQRILVLQPDKPAALLPGQQRYSEATLAGHLRGEGDEAGDNAGDVLDGDAPIAAALADLKKSIGTAATGDAAQRD